METPDDFELGVTARPLHLNAAPEHRDLVLAMARQAKRTLHIYSRELDAKVYDDPEVEEVFTRFALRSQNCRILILVQEPAELGKYAHAVVRLAQQLSSRVQIKVPNEEQRDYGQAFFVADTMGFIRQPVADRYAAEANFKAPFEARKLQQYFEEVWEQADSAPELRRLYL